MRYLKRLYEAYKEEFDLNLKEGLIKTNEIQKSVAILKRNTSKIFNFQLYLEDNQFTVKFDLKNLKSGDLERLIQYSNNLGWYCSFIDNSHYKGKFDFDKVFIGVNTLMFEATFDIRVEKYDRYLYHITPSQNASKILKRGLFPKTRSKASFHPERVYLSDNVDFLSYDLAEMFYQVTGQKEWILLKIDTYQIPNYFQLYRDPNVSVEDGGYYTLNNIPPHAITLHKEIKFSTNY
jgi:hypothetical protein